MFGRDLFEHPESVPTAPANGAAARAFAVLLMNFLRVISPMRPTPFLIGYRRTPHFKKFVIISRVCFVKSTEFNSKTGVKNATVNGSHRPGY